jgi:hypothetical protein
MMGKPTRFQEVPGPGFKASLMQQRSSAAFAQSLDMCSEVDQGIYEAETTPPTTFRQWCEEVFRPAVGGSS